MNNLYENAEKMIIIALFSFQLFRTINPRFVLKYCGTLMNQHSPIIIISVKILIIYLSISITQYTLLMETIMVFNYNQMNGTIVAGRGAPNTTNFNCLTGIIFDADG